MKLFANYCDDYNKEYYFEAESVKGIQDQLPKDYDGTTIRVYDELGFVRGYIGVYGYIAT